ncbi:hypothetical protein HDU84_002677 [Entophlyctis sp. JEL0112]|nr:hypothetical protein HDU84_002677 [Entophlyctis sp. JEL0112]
MAKTPTSTRASRAAAPASNVQTIIGSSDAMDMDSHDLAVPAEFPALLKDLNREVLRAQPKDIYQFCATYFHNKLAEQRRELIELAAGISSQDESGQQPVRARASSSSSVMSSNADDDDDDEEATDVPQQPPPPVQNNYNRARRTSVSAESMAPTLDTNYVPIVIPKTPEQTARIHAAIAQNFLFKSCDEEQYRDVVAAMAEKRVSAGEEVIRQGGVGDYFYVVETGALDVFVSKNGNPPARVYQYSDGGSFGELALMYNAPRAATVVATADCVLWALDRVTFRRILMENTSRKRRMYESFLEEVKLLSSLEPYERHKIADVLESIVYNDGEVVIKQGDVGEQFYIIESGEASVSKVIDGVEHQYPGLKKGDYFGELALLTDQPRQATIRAVGKLKVATMGKKAFVRLLGPVVDIIKRNASDYAQIKSHLATKFQFLELKMLSGFVVVLHATAVLASSFGWTELGAFQNLANHQHSLNGTRSEVHNSFKEPLDPARVEIEQKETPKQPNIIFILTDDQDLHMNSLDYMPLVKKHLVDKGTQFVNHSTTTAICCPSRVSILKGQFAHNTQFVDVHGEFGGYDKFLSKGLNEEYLPKWLQRAGYATYYVGKFLNGYGIENRDQVPGGWNIFDALVHPYVYDNFHPVFSKNGGNIDDFEGTFQVDVVRDKALDILSDALKNTHEGVPFFLYLAPTAPHTEILFSRNPPDGVPYGRVTMTEAVPAKRHEHLFADAQVPRRKNFNPLNVEGKPDYISDLPLLSNEEIQTLDHWHRQRLRSLQSVDELVESVVKAVEEAGEIDNTYIFYSSDNGYHLGLHRLNAGKTTPYEDDVNIPLIVRGPQVARGVTREGPSTHTDLAPTFVKLAGATNIAYEFDGSPIPIHEHDTDNSDRESFAVEFWRPHESELFPIPRISENIYRSLRVVSKKYSYLYTVWCTGHRELYDHLVDPDQIDNIYESTSVALINRLDALLLILKDCIGVQCLNPWNSLHPKGNVKNLGQALDAEHDEFYQTTGRLHIKQCLRGFYPENEIVVSALTR